MPRAVRTLRVTLRPPGVVTRSGSPFTHPGNGGCPYPPAKRNARICGTHPAWPALGSPLVVPLGLGNWRGLAWGSRACAHCRWSEGAGPARGCPPRLSRPGLRPGIRAGYLWSRVPCNALLNVLPRASKTHDAALSPSSIRRSPACRIRLPKAPSRAPGGRPGTRRRSPVP